MRVSVVCAWPVLVWRRELDVAVGTTVAEVLSRVPWQEATGLDEDTLRTGIFGRRVGAGEILRPGDRIELYRPLQIDPKQVRRERAGDGGNHAHRPPLSAATGP
ncbi:hypothetical protein B1808_00905 [Pseudofulvimonas gallinarii]|nr:hypothetical protein B1808_00905 [Pseudofulvimonas gallinarii]